MSDTHISGGVIVSQITTGGGGGGCDCAITDDFARILVSTWGEATCGLSWVVSIFAPNTISVDGDAGLITVVDVNSVSMSLGTGSPGLQYPVDDSIKTMRFQIPDFAPLGTTNAYILSWSPMDHPGFVFGPTLGIADHDTGPTPRSFIDYTAFHSGVVGTIPGSFWNSSKTYTWTIWKTVTGQSQTISDGSTSYTLSSGSNPSFAECNLRWGQNASTFAADATLRVLDIDIPEITRCALVQFEDFEDRTNANTSHSWGIAHPGGQTWVLDNYLNTYQYVAGGYGIIRNNNVIPSSSGYGYMSVHEPVVPMGSDWHVKIPVIHTSTTSVYNNTVSITIDGILFDWFRNGIGTPKLRAEAAVDPYPAEVEQDFPYPTFWPDHDGTVVIVEAERLGSVFRFRLYGVADPVPDWQLTTVCNLPVPARVPMDQWYMQVSTGVSPSVAGQTELKIGDIDIFYPGRPCYTGGPPPDPEVTTDAAFVSGSVSV